MGDLDGDDGAAGPKVAAEHVLVGVVGQAADVDGRFLVDGHLAAGDED